MKLPLSLLLAALAAAVAVYWPGLSSGFLLDDDANLGPVWEWLRGETGWLQVVMQNGSGPLGRPISMLSFIVNAGLWGQSAFALKAVNLALHLATGCAIFGFLAQLFKRDTLLRDKRLLCAAAVAAVWLLHPLFASTVLYVVQRMAILSAFFMVLGLWAYVHGRLRIEEGHSRSGLIWIFAVVPLTTILAAFSKENGALLPLLCGVIEWTHFTPSHGYKRAQAGRWFLGVFVAAPILLGIAYLLLNPDFFLAGYENRPFTLGERLLTQSRILFDYVGNLLLPVGQHFSLYRDSYPLSSGLLRPITTLFALLAWLLIIASAIGLSRVIPGLAAGIGIYLVGHLTESSIYPLLMYFEHRNYLPGIGVFVATISVLAYVAHFVSARMDRPNLVVGGALVGLLLALSFATWARSLAWQNPRYLLEQSVSEYPDSRFARMELAALLMNDAPGPDVDGAIEHYQHLQGLELPSTRTIGYVGEIAVSCFSRGKTAPENLSAAFAQPPETIQSDYLKALEELGIILRRRDCEGASASEYADHLVAVADTTHLPQGARPVWRLRFEAARLYHSEQQIRKALEQAKLAWSTGAADLPVGMMVVGLHIRMGEFGAASKLLDQIGPQIPKTDRQGQSLLESYRSAIEEGARRSIFSPATEG